MIPIGHSGGRLQFCHQACNYSIVLPSGFPVNSGLDAGVCVSLCVVLGLKPRGLASLCGQRDWWGPWEPAVGLDSWTQTLGLDFSQLGGGVTWTRTALAFDPLRNVHPLFCIVMSSPRVEKALP